MNIVENIKPTNILWRISRSTFSPVTREVPLSGFQTGKYVLLKNSVIFPLTIQAIPL